MAYATMYGNWAGSGYQGRLVAEVDDLPAISADTSSIDVTLRWHVEFSVNTWDSSNTFVTSGSWPYLSGAISFATTTKAWNVRVQTITIWPAFGTTTALTVSGSLTGIDNIGATMGLSATVNIPAKPYRAALQPLSYAVTRSEASQTSHTWVTNCTSGSGAYPWSSVRIDRSINGGDWATATTLNWDATSWTDTALAGDRRYNYRISALGPGGRSDFVTGGPIYTKPSAPTNAAATKDAAGDITVTWDSPSTTATKWNVWHASNGTWDSTAIASSVTSRTWKHVAPSAAATHTYRIVAVAPDGTTLSDNSTASNVVQLLARPNAPTGTSPNGGYRDKASAITLTWLHNPVDGTPQSAYEIQARTSADNGATWTAWSTIVAKTTATVTQHTLAAATFGLARVEWQVRTYGTYATAPAYSPWSATAVFTTSTSPSATITTPTTGQVLTTNQVSLAWSFSGAASTTQASWSAVLKDGSGSVLETRSGTSTMATTFDYRLANSASCTVTLTVTDSNGLTSAPTICTFSTSYAPPPEPGVQPLWDADLGLVTLTITNAAGVSNTVYRRTHGSWLSLGTVGPNTSITDTIPEAAPTGAYKVVTLSSLGTTSSTTVEVPMVSLGWIWVNYGPGFAQRARARFNPELSSSFSRSGTRYTFAGRKRAVTLAGPARDYSVSASCLIEEGDPIGNRQAWMSVIDVGDIVCYRDPLGRRIFGSVSGVRFQGESLDLTNLAFTVEEEDFAEGQ